MTQSAVWMLLSEGEANAIAAPLTARIGMGTRGEALRRVSLPDASADAKASAEIGAHQAYGLLYREKYLDRRAAATFDAGASLQNVHGRSGDLAFALAFAAGVCASRRDAPMAPVAASGQLDEDGALSPVANVAAKLAAAIRSLPAGAVMIFPQENESDAPAALRASAAEHGLKLVFAARLEDALQHAGVALSQTWRGSPFRGLEAFTFEHAAIFFGRDQEIDELVTLLAHQLDKDEVGLLIEGPSGSGKSSLALAGLMPALMRRGVGSVSGEAIRWGALRPSGRSLDDTLRAAWTHGRQGGLTACVDGGCDLADPDAHWAWLQAQSTPDTQFVLVLDQLDEWFDADQATIRRVAELAFVLRQRGVWLIGVATRVGRSKLSAHPVFGQCFGVEGRYTLSGVLDGTRLEAIIHGPAKVARLTFEPGLAAEIFQRASNAGEDILPVLELLLTELYERRDTSRNLLQRDDYKAVGGFDGVVTTRAEAAFSQVDSAAQTMVGELLWRLASCGEIRSADFPAEHPMQCLCAALQQRRLLVSDENPEGRSSFRAAHDALLRLWPRAVSFRKEHEADLQLWSDLARESTQWRGGRRALIPEGPQLAAAVVLYDKRMGAWRESDGPTLEFIRASRDQHSRRRLMRSLALGAPIAVVVGGGAYALFNHLQERSWTRIDFESIRVPGPDYAVAAAPYLRRYGIFVSARSPSDARLLIRSNIGLYQGHAASPYRGEHFLTLEADPATAPISYTLRFSSPPRALDLIRAGLWATSNNGVSHPAWNVVAFDDAGASIARASEPTRAAFRQGDEIPPRAFTLEPGGGARIAQIEITSDFRDQQGRPYAAFQAVLLKEIILIL